MCPDVQHLYALVERSTLTSIHDKVVIIYGHVLTRLPCEVSDNAETLPCEVGTETTDPWCIAVLTQEYRVLFLIIILSNITVLVVVHWLTSTRINTSIANAVELTVRVTYLEFQTCIGNYILIAT